MSQANVEIAKEAIDAFNRRDVDAFMEFTTSDFELFPALAGAVEGGSFRGREGMEAYFEASKDTWEELRLIAEEIRDPHSSPDSQESNRNAASPDFDSLDTAPIKPAMPTSGTRETWAGGDESPAFSSGDQVFVRGLKT